MNSNNFVLTDRDMNVLNLTFRFKTVNLSDIQAWCFKETHYSAVTRRMRKLESLKLIRRNLIFNKDKRASALFELTPLGLTKIKSFGHSILRNQIRSNYPEHDLNLVKLVKWLSGLKTINSIITENELLGLEIHQNEESLREFIELKPDGVLNLNLKGHSFRVALEYELHAKSQSRWKDKLGNYYLAETIDAVLYFCATASMMKKLMEVDRELTTNRNSKMFFFLFEGPIEDQSLGLKNSKGEEFVLN